MLSRGARSRPHRAKSDASAWGNATWAHQSLRLARLRCPARRRGRVARQRPAKPRTPVRFWSAPSDARKFARLRLACRLPGAFSRGERRRAAAAHVACGGQSLPRYCRPAVCFELDSSPPIPIISGAAVSHDDLVLEAKDGNRFAAFAATPDEPNGIGVVILPDVRGLYRFYEALALRFAERGYTAVALDYFGRTAGIE